MIDYQIEASKTTPFVRVSSDEGKIIIEGRSTPENAIAFYYPIIELIRLRFVYKPRLTVELSLEYFNTSSSKCLFDLLKMVKKVEGLGARVVVNWYVEEDDDDMREAGEDYADILDLDFQYKTYFPNPSARVLRTA